MRSRRFGHQSRPHRSAAAAIVLATGMLWLLACGPPARAAQTAFPELGAYALQVQQKGHPGTIPPHLSLVLGLNTAGGQTPGKGRDKGIAAQATPSRQVSARSNGTIHAFFVLAAPSLAIVMITHEERSDRTTAWLLAGDGALVRAVTYQGAGQSSALAPAAAQAGYLGEGRYWSAFAKGARRRADRQPVAAAVHR